MVGSVTRFGEYSPYDEYKGQSLFCKLTAAERHAWRFRANGPAMRRWEGKTLQTSSFVCMEDARRRKVVLFLLSPATSLPRPPPPPPPSTSRSSSRQAQYEAVCERERRAALRNAALLRDLQKLQEQVAIAAAAAQTSRLSAQRVSSAWGGAYSWYLTSPLLPSFSPSLPPSLPPSPLPPSLCPASLF